MNRTAMITTTSVLLLAACGSDSQTDGVPSGGSDPAASQAQSAGVSGTGGTGGTNTITFSGGPAPNNDAGGTGGTDGNGSAGNGAQTGSDAGSSEGIPDPSGAGTGPSKLGQLCETHAECGLNEVCVSGNSCLAPGNGFCETALPCTDHGFDGVYVECNQHVCAGEAGCLCYHCQDADLGNACFVIDECFECHFPS